MPKRKEEQVAHDNEIERHEVADSKSGAVSVWVKEQADAGMHEIERRLREQWGLVYDRPELLRLIAQVAIQLIELELVVRVGLHFAVEAPHKPQQPWPAEAHEAQAGRRRGHAVWVGGVTMAGLHWIQEWLHETGYQANRSDVLELAVDLSLQAMDAGLVLRPKGPQVTVHRPESNATRRHDRGRSSA